MTQRSTAHRAPLQPQPPALFTPLGALTVTLALTLLLCPALAHAQDKANPAPKETTDAPASSSDTTSATTSLAAPPKLRPRPTIQNRFAIKKGAIHIHALGNTHIRDDYYDSWGFGADLGFYFFESLGVELRAMSLSTSLSDEALDLKERLGLTPDARPQGTWLLGGARYSFGYGKFLLFDSWVVHFDPQLALHGGVALAETRTLPTLTLAPSLLMHFRWGLQAKIDLAFSFQWEERARGSVFSMGFSPILGLGWSFNLFNPPSSSKEGT